MKRAFWILLCIAAAFALYRAVHAYDEMLHAAPPSTVHQPSSVSF